MGVLDKLAFWKKKDAFDFDSFAHKEFSQDPLQASKTALDSDPFAGSDPANPTISSHSQFSAQADPFAAPPPAPANLQPQGFSSQSNNHELDLVNSKLDTLKALMSSIDQRLANLERKETTQKKEPRLW